MLDALEDHGCFGESGTNAQMHAYFVAGLERLADEFPQWIHGPYGVGMMIAWTPGDGSMEVAKQMVDMMFEEGLIGFICGAEPTRLRFLPPPVVTEESHVDAALSIMRRCLQRMEAAQQGT